MDPDPGIRDSGLGTDAFHHVFPEVASRVQVPLMPFLMAGALGNSPLVQR
ncbi:MAG: hypothetical protein HYX76_00005, partial [Acidobacteria bacterium]|nr:hypothetical protein [Acidobacteriota bacterium]